MGLRFKPSENQITRLLNWKENFPIFLLGLYVIGYVHLKVYYWFLGINIEYFISLTDIVFFAINLLFIIAIPLFLGQFVLNIIISVIIERIHKEDFAHLTHEEKQKLIETSKKGEFTGLYIFFLLVLTIIGIIVTGEIAYFISLFFLILFLKVIYTVYQNKSSDENKVAAILLMFFTLVIFSLVSGYKKSKDIENQLYYYFPVKEVQFKTNNNLIVAGKDKTYLFIGQTTDYIFIYDILTAKSKIYRKDSITELEFINQ